MWDHWTQLFDANAILVRGLDQIITFWSQGAELLYGWSQHEALGRDKRDVLRTRYPRPPEEIDADLLRLGHWQGELVHQTKHGKELVVAGRWALQRDSQGRPRDVLEINLDVTAYKQIEAELRHAHEELEARVADRTRELSRANLAQEVMLKEIHHRVKNNLQVISSLLSLQARTLDDSAAANILRESQLRVQSMALIHEKLYQSQDYSRVHFADYIRSLASELFRAYRASSRAIRWQCHAENVLLTMDVAIPCGLILNEILTNCLKHAFPGERQGEIRITFGADRDKYLLRVADDGVGIPAGVDFQTSRSLGLRLIRTLADQLDGAIDLQRESGTIYELRIPAKTSSVAERIT